MTKERKVFRLEVEYKIPIDGCGTTKTVTSHIPIGAKHIGGEVSDESISSIPDVERFYESVQVGEHIHILDFAHLLVDFESEQPSIQQLTVPVEWVHGAPLVYTTPDGQQWEAHVPRGTQAGDTFIVQSARPIAPAENLTPGWRQITPPGWNPIPSDENFVFNLVEVELARFGGGIAKGGVAARLAAAKGWCCKLSAMCAGVLVRC